MAWEDFERLCLRLARLNASVEHCRLYGVRGQKQQGIDLYARSIGGGDYAVYQCKRVAQFGPSAIKNAVRAFRRGTWFGRASALYICTSNDGSKVRMVEEFERQQKALRKQGKSLVLWDVGELSRVLKNEPLIVDDFFGRSWTSAFCGEQAATELGRRLDAAAVVAFRGRLRSLYTDVFNGHDPGIPIPPRPGAAPIPLGERYVLPDVLVSQILRSSASSREPGETAPRSGPERRSATAQPSIQREREPLITWLAKADHSILLGAPGSGKSSFLRYLALDLLSDEPRFEALAHRWGQRLPVWIPFAFWCQQVSSGADPSLRECVRRWLSQWSMDELFPLVEAAIEDRRLLLLVDGVDEWTTEDAGRIVSQLIQGFATLHRAAVIVTSRPYGLERISFSGSSWQVAELAPLSASQRKELCRQWFVLKASKDVSEREDAVASGAYANREAERLTTELARSAELAPLSTVPLLLLLLIFMRFQRAALPRGRFDAYDRMLDHVLREHPQAKRVAASITEPGGMLDEVSTRQALANLAFVVQSEYPNGVIGDSQFESVVHAFLTDRSNTGLGLSPAESNRYLPQFSRLAEGTLGVLVRQGTRDLSFIHRSFQEFLAAQHLARLPLVTQEQTVGQHCVTPQWREVILGLISQTSRPDDVRRLIETIEPYADESVSGLAVRELLTEIGFAEFSVPPDVVDRVTSEGLTRIERHFWMPHRQRLLTFVLDGLRSARLRERVRRQVRRWVFDRGVWSDWSTAISRWPYDDNVVFALTTALHSENAHIQRGASHALAGIAKGVPAVGDIMASLARTAPAPLVRAAALDGLHRGWPAHAQLDAAIKQARESISGELRLSGIRALVHRAEHAQRDLEELLVLGDHDEQWELDYAWRTDVADLLTQGWPANARLKEVCLSATPRWMSSDQRLEREIAWGVMLRAFPGDPDVSRRCAAEIEQEDHPFVGVAHFSAWEAIATNFRDDAAIGAAIEKWAAKQKFIGPDLSYAALVTRPDSIKSILIRGLNESFPHWSVKALLDGWGMEDDEVSAALIGIALGPADRASNIATEIPRILVEPVHARARLLELLADPKCKRPDFVIKGLASLNLRSDEAEIAAVSLGRLGSDEPSGALVDGGADQLIEFFGCDPAVRAYAMKSLDWRRPPLASAAVALADIPEARERIVDLIGHLPLLLRRQIIEELSTSTDEEFAQQVLELYDVETDGELKTSAAIAYFSRIDRTSALASTVSERLGQHLSVVGPGYDERRQAAFAALATLERLDVMVPLTEHFGEVQPLAISLGHHGHPNLPLLRLIAQNWKSIKEAFGESVPSRLAGHLSAPFWQSMALVAREFADVRDALLEAASSDAKLARTPEVLLLRASVQPRSPSLRDACINALDESGREQWEFDSVDEAAGILGDQFAGDSETLSLLKELDPSVRTQGVILALCAGWPESAELAGVFEAFTRRDRHLALNYRTMFALKYTCTPAEDLVKALRDDLRRGRKFVLPILVKPLRRRIVRDRNAQAAFEGVINDGASPTAKATTARLLAIATGLNEQLRAWSEVEVRRQLRELPAPELAFDLVSNSVRAVADSLLDALAGLSGVTLVSSS